MGIIKHWSKARKPWDNVLGSFLMREELCRRLQARQVWIMGGMDGIKLDCCFIPAQRVHPVTGVSTQGGVGDMGSTLLSRIRMVFLTEGTDSSDGVSLG